MPNYERETNGPQMPSTAARHYGGRYHDATQKQKEGGKVRKKHQQLPKLANASPTKVAAVLVRRE